MPMSHASPCSDAWQPTAAPPPLDTAALHLWAIEIDARLTQAGDLFHLLCPEEQDRANARSRNPGFARFVVGRAMLRQLLAGYLNVSPQAIAFRYNPQGKPSIALPASSGLQFNLAHSSSMAVCAVTASSQVGIDLERINARRDFEGVAARFFNEAETCVLRKLPEARRALAFYRIWTQKEAYVKALGSGIASQIQHFDVEAAPDQPMRLIANRQNPSEPGRWRFIEPPPISGYAAAVAVASGAWQVAHFRFSP